MDNKRHWYKIENEEESLLGFLFVDNVSHWERKGYKVTRI